MDGWMDEGINKQMMSEQRFILGLNAVNHFSTLRSIKGIFSL
jgi:hypothetical protein